MPETKITDVRVPLPWEEAAPLVEVAKEKAARQFLAIWRGNHHRRDEELRWGEEIEYMLVDVASGGAKALICADEVLRRLGQSSGDGTDPTSGAGWRTEYGNMMVEGVTLPPFTWSLEEVLRIEPSLAWRRQELERMTTEVAGPSARVVTLSAFPLLGVPGGLTPPYGSSEGQSPEPAPDGKVSQSVLCPDEATSPHPRYQTFTANYRKRKGCKVAAFIPREGLPPDKRLRAEQVERLPFELARKASRERDPVDGYIYMDSQSFGACQCCTQATFLAHDLEEARYLTDQFVVLAPLMLALTAATPFLRGLVADTDTRWEAFQQCWDDRREEELESVRNSRTSANDLMISRGLEPPTPVCEQSATAVPEAAAGVNDVELPVHEPALAMLTAVSKEENAAQLDPVLSYHVAHLLARDPLMIFKDRMEIDDTKEADHWEQLQGTNWGTARFKPPPSDGSIGWRVEFRSPEVQLTDFENAAIVGVIRLITEVLVEQRLDLVIPVSLCDENDGTSAAREAASQQRFWFRCAATDTCAEVPSDDVVRFASGSGDSTAFARKMPLSEILSGVDGIFTRCRTFLEQRCLSGQCSEAARAKLEEYMRLFERRATGELPTPASYLRKWLATHAEYKGDGVVPESFVHDLCVFAADVNRPGAPWLTDLLGSHSSANSDGGDR